MSLLISASSSRKDPEVEVAQLCANLAVAHSVLSTFFKSAVNAREGKLIPNAAD